MSAIVQCESCGGTVVFDAEFESSKCLFCGSSDLAAPQEGEEEEPSPDFALSLQIGREQADTQYREWATSSWWNPKELRSLQVELRLMYLPAWWIRGEVESHWGGLISANTKSRKAPTSGLERATYEDIVAASQGLSSAELAELLPFVLEDAQPWSELSHEIPFEVPGMSEEAARGVIHERLSSAHLSDIQTKESLLSGVSSSFVHEESHRLYMLPVYIGAFRFREQPWRFLINAQTGEVVGDAPVDRTKIGLVIGVTLLIFGLVALMANA